MSKQIKSFAIPRETKQFTFQIKAIGSYKTDAGEFGQIEAYGAVFGNVDDGNDRIQPNAFKRTINDSKARATAREKKYLIPMLWQHNPNELMGGWYDLKEDNYGLLCKGDIALGTQRGREYYELAKAGMADQFSIVYDVPTGGAKYDKSGVRDLTELRLFSVDPVTFAMNEETLLVGVKSMEWKSVVGNTSGPIGPRDESWDGARAKREIWAAAEKEDGSINTSLAKKYFMVVEGDPQKKGSYGYPFWFVGSSPHICVGAVKAIAAAIQGARGANAPSGLKSKVSTLYNRINKKYPSDTPLTPPWEDDGKAMTMTMQRKTFIEHYQEEMCEDLMEDWHSLYLCALTCAVLDAFKIGDEPESDVSDALDAFKETVMGKFVAQAIEWNLSEYLDEEETSYPSDGELSMLSPHRQSYGYMSRSQRRLMSKAGRAISAATAATLQSHIDNLHDMAQAHMKEMKRIIKEHGDMVEDHAKTLHDVATELAKVLPGAETQKAGRAISTSNADTIQTHVDAMHEIADGHIAATKSMADAYLGAAKSHTKMVTTAADDLATVLQGSEAAYGTDPGKPDDAQQEGKQRASSLLARTRTHLTSSSRSGDAIAEDELTAGLSKIRQLRTSLH